MKTTTYICAAILACTLAIEPTIGAKCRVKTTTPTMGPIVETHSPSSPPGKTKRPIDVETHSPSSPPGKTKRPIDVVPTPGPVGNRTDDGNTNGPGSSGEGGLSEAEQKDMLARINAVRAENGAEPLKINPQLMDAACKHSQEQATRCVMGHSFGTSPSDRAKASGYSSGVSENVAAGQQTVDDVMDAWIKSPGHFQNLIRTNSKEVGFGRADNSNCPSMKKYWTQNFG